MIANADPKMSYCRGNKDPITHTVYERWALNMCLKNNGRVLPVQNLSIEKTKQNSFQNTAREEQEKSQSRTRSRGHPDVTRSVAPLVWRHKLYVSAS
jgi:hypothetical protein